MKTLKSHLLNRPRRKNIYTPSTSPNLRIAVLSTPATDPLPLPVLETQSKEGWEISTYSVSEGYDDMTVEEVLRTLIKDPDVEIPTSFESVGHIAHMNLRENVMPWKYVVGRVVLNKNKNIKKVITKVGTIENEFRTFDMECIAGVDDGNYEVELKEEGNRFKLDFSAVYWNSKLAGEHRRVVEEISCRKSGKSNRGVVPSVSKGTATKGTTSKEAPDTPSTPPPVVADVMAGIGPFAIPLASKFGVSVLANDLTPSSHKYLLQNSRLNKCSDKLKPYNLDGREFIHKLSDEGVRFQYAIMNLPAIAVEFLDAFRGFSVSRCGRPTVYVYGFYKADTEEEIEGLVRGRCEDALGCGITEDCGFVIHRVRDVAPKKPMVCARFRIPREVEGMERVDLGDYDKGIRRKGREGPDRKRRKVE